jgi:hypothetical protein
MGFFTSLGKALVNTVTLPVSVAKDLVTGEIIEERNATTRNADRLRRNAESMAKAVDDE